MLVVDDEQAYISFLTSSPVSLTGSVNTVDSFNLSHLTLLATPTMPSATMPSNDVLDLHIVIIGAGGCYVTTGARSDFNVA